MFRIHLRHRYCDTLRVREKGTRPSPVTLHLRTAGDAHCEREINLRRCALQAETGEYISQLLSLLLPRPTLSRFRNLLTPPEHATSPSLYHPYAQVTQSNPFYKDRFYLTASTYTRRHMKAPCCAPYPPSRSSRAYVSRGPRNRSVSPLILRPTPTSLCTRRPKEPQSKSGG
ncbi:hypothetical protein [Fowl adenovirus 8b]|uniref:Uncharacterized protein n=1 Tax=Fowl adenovirus 8b TaxID=586029 RepID=A0A160CBM5_9ADEN|nr:hypothetical protein [Fowl adenovirus 8b]